MTIQDTKFDRPKPLYKSAEWNAVNGHLMVGRKASYDAGKTWQIEGWSAQHSSNCRCEDGGATVEDF